MHCERARAVLFEHLDRDPHDRTDAELDAHLATCAECAALRQDLQSLQAQVRVWHELSPPLWNPAPDLLPGVALRTGSGRFDWRVLLQQWLPLTASMAALMLTVALFWRSGAAPDGAVEEVPVAGPVAGDPPVEQLLATSRQERQEEMEALTALLKAEMDRRSLETEESLKYIISHQIQSQRELDAIRSRLPENGGSTAEQL